MGAMLQHPTLRSTLQGVEDSTTVQYRGVPYGRIPKRFAAAEFVQVPGYLDCTQFGPRCPQVQVDIGHLLRIPLNRNLPQEVEDELRCTNLDVVVPKLDPSHLVQLPVLAFIHGGSQAVTFGSSASGVCDMRTFVTDSIDLRKPFIGVNIQYRLNILAVGDGKGGPCNLALGDQELALGWIQTHIAGFGGDPDNVTIAGESAGAVYCHAHIARNAPVKQAVLASGSLYLSPPQPPKNVSILRDTVLKYLKELDPEAGLQSAPVHQLITAIKQSGLQSFFLQAEDRLDKWEENTGKVQRIMLSDVQNEAVIWQAGVRGMEVADIISTFDKSGPLSDELKAMYHIHAERPTSTKTGALDFINDYKFVLPINHLIRLFKKSAKPVYRFLVDESNPWQPSSGAHHAVDLILLFGGLDMGDAYAARRTGRNMREAWIRFINGDEPWVGGADSWHAFGPHGISKSLEKWELDSYKRVSNVERLSQMDTNLLNNVLSGLATGNVSLLN
ncbi:unnamed protein product [Clonostachys rosea]|uniref:Carboxylic ester hydrolase n=1 Tax=Bionectria ochroleuca TaxID=29856 RepID=A0ABY6V452_BIOOC|nr:unnamed protein product [Clonostachys rosea]